jgi:hypothetical protein
MKSTRWRRWPGTATSTRRIRYVLARNPKEALRDKEKRELILSKIKEELAKLGDLAGEPHCKACCELIAHKSYGRYLMMDEQGQPHIDKAKVKAEESLDGKYLIRTSDDTLSPVDVALGYKQLYQVENAFCTLKTTLELRPVYHRLRTGSVPTSCSAGWPYCWYG